MPDVIATPAPGANIVEAPSRPAQAGVAPPSGGEIKVVPPPAEPAAPPKPGTARARLAAALQDKAKPAFGSAAARREVPPAQKPADAKPAAAAEQPKGPVSPQPLDKKAGDAAKPEPKAGNANDTQQTSPMEDSDVEPGDEELEKLASDKSQKKNPWRLVKDLKKKVSEVQKQHEETRKLIADEPTRKAEVERLTKAEQRAKELEDHIRFVDYEKSNEFAEKYHKPYEASWERGMSELQGITVQDQNGNERPLNPNDMLELLNLPLPKARELANELYGDFADDVMAQRKEIRTMFDARTRALDEARKSGAERERTARAEAERVNGKVSEEVTKLWRGLNEESLKDETNSQYFKPKEGDSEWNSRLEKGFELVDKAFAVNPMDPRLTSDERKEAIRKHVAIRNRAAAYGALKSRDTAHVKRIVELEAELAEYRKSTPDLRGSEDTSEAPATGGKARDQVFGALKKLAK